MVWAPVWARGRGARIFGQLLGYSAERASSFLVSRKGSKLTDYAGTGGYLTQTGDPTPSVTAFVAIVVEVFVALALGVWTRPLALLLALFTVCTALIGHRF